MYNESVHPVVNSDPANVIILPDQVIGRNIFLIIEIIDHIITTEVEGKLLIYFRKEAAVRKWGFQFCFHQQIVADNLPEQGVRSERLGVKHISRLFIGGMFNLGLLDLHKTVQAGAKKGRLCSGS